MNDAKTKENMQVKQYATQSEELLDRSESEDRVMDSVGGISVSWKGNVRHAWNDEFCSCGQDAVTCQVCGRRVCGNLTQQIPGKGNVCDLCVSNLKAKQAETETAPIQFKRSLQQENDFLRSMIKQAEKELVLFKSPKSALTTLQYAIKETEVA